MSLEITPIKPLIGSVVHADKEALLSGRHAQEIRTLLEARGVLVFPRIGFSDEEHVAFTKTLGTFAPDPGEEEQGVYRIALDRARPGGVEYLLGSMYWHIDGTMNEVPIFASLLAAKVIPPEGAATEFSNTYAAYEALPAEEKRRIESLRVLHSAWATLFYYDPEPPWAKLAAMMELGDRELPLVWTHRSGRRSLVLGATAYHVQGLSVRDARALLVRLRDWATQPQFVYRHEWQVGDLVMWDNTGTMHRALPYDPASGRLLHRTKLAGEEPFSAECPEGAEA